MKSNWIYYIFIGIFVLYSYYLMYNLQIYSSFNTEYSSRKNKTIQHNAVILTRRPSVKVLKHLNALLGVGVNAFVMSDEPLTNYTNLTNRVIYINDKTLDRYGLFRNRAWDRAFVWLYNETSIDYVWILEDDVTWSHVNHMVTLFKKYENNSADLLSKHIIHRSVEPHWIWWPATNVSFLPEKKWIGAINMLSRLSRRIINAHQYYTLQLLNEKTRNKSKQIDDNYYFVEFFIPTAGRMFNLTMLVYNNSNMDVDIGVLGEDDIRRGLSNGKQIFHAVKHDSKVLVNATLY